MRRSLTEKLDKRKEMMIAALWANSGFEGQEGSNARSQAITDLEENYDEAVTMILSGAKPREEEIDPNNPFFSPTYEAMKKLEVPEGSKVSDVLAATEGFQQSIDGLDQ